ncbi:MAG: sigma-70 family RNA polymerase sigma factor [Gammaproteobacteria bacterium]|nr:sigma-70 family RNA polymerase sigma factor [Gammaproteobacteria bacterium]
MKNDDSLVVQNMELVRRIAQRVHRPLPTHIQLDDLIQDGMIGLLEAAERYNPALNDSFSAYATPTIRGRILDGIRSFGTRTRAGIRAHKQIAGAIRAVEATTCRPARETEIAQYLGMESIQISKLLASCESTELLGYDELCDDRFCAEAPAATRPEQSLETHDAVEELFFHVRKLNRRQRTVFIKYFLEGLRLRDIAKSMNICESRVSQIKDELLAAIRKGVRAST